MIKRIYATVVVELRPSHIDAFGAKIDSKIAARTYLVSLFGLKQSCGAFFCAFDFLLFRFFSHEARDHGIGSHVRADNGR